MRSGALGPGLSIKSGDDWIVAPGSDGRRWGNQHEVVPAPAGLISQLRSIIEPEALDDSAPTEAIEAAASPSDTILPDAMAATVALDSCSASAHRTSGDDANRAQHSPDGLSEAPADGGGSGGIEPGNSAGPASAPELGDAESDTKPSEPADRAASSDTTKAADMTKPWTPSEADYTPN